MYDATGSYDEEECPRCGNRDTVTWHFADGFEEMECRTCGWVSDAEELAALQRFGGRVLEREDSTGSPVNRLSARIKA